MIDSPGLGIAGDAPQQVEAILRGVVDCREVALLQIGDDATLRARQVNEVPLDVTLDAVLINGRASPDRLAVRSGVPQRLRLINMTTRRPRIRAELWHDSTPVSWRPLAKDGADLPAKFRHELPARAPISIGGTMDFEFVPSADGTWRLVVRSLTGAVLSTQSFRVVASSSN